MRKLIAALIAFWIILPAMGRTQSATPTYECDGGSNVAIVNACAVRWEAANIRAHVAAGAYGGATPKCLERTAWLLDDMAGKWLKRNAFNAYNGPWPCGKHPAIAKADDGVLAAACPNRVWSYDNRGSAGCSPSRTQVAQQQAQPPTRAMPAPASTPFDFDYLSNIMASREHNFRWWDGGSVDAGDYHDRTVSNSALFNSCTFTIAYHESDADGRTWEQTWTGNLRLANPYAISAVAIAATPANWRLRFETTGRAPNFGYTGTTQPSDANYAVDLIFPYNPTLAINTLRAAILWCKSSS
ncbi:MAG: hypothetical protein ABSE64_01145 [Vulcanimicrobiaceae bacterium]|jgi:hypothetical protein